MSRLSSASEIVQKGSKMKFRELMRMVSTIAASL